jgi:hypothetical protein
VATSPCTEALAKWSRVSCWSLSSPVKPPQVARDFPAHGTCQASNVLVAGCGQRVEQHGSIGLLRVYAIHPDDVEMNIQIQRGSKSLHHGQASGLQPTAQLALSCAAAGYQTLSSTGARLGISKTRLSVHVARARKPTTPRAARRRARLLARFLSQAQASLQQGIQGHSRQPCSPALREPQPALPRVQRSFFNTAHLAQAMPCRRPAGPASPGALCGVVDIMYIIGRKTSPSPQSLGVTVSSARLCLLGCRGERDRARVGDGSQGGSLQVRGGIFTV